MYFPRLLIEENTSSLLVRVLRDQGLTGEVSVVYVITNGGAVNGEDFTAVSLDVGCTIVKLYNALTCCLT